MLVCFMLVLVCFCCCDSHSSHPRKFLCILTRYWSQIFDTGRSTVLSISVSATCSYRVPVRDFSIPVDSGCRLLMSECDRSDGFHSPERQRRKSKTRRTQTLDRCDRLNKPRGIRAQWKIICPHPPLRKTRHLSTPREQDCFRKEAILQYLSVALNVVKKGSAA
jgi:hypothetical protein